MRKTILLAVTMTVSMTSWADVERGKQLHDEQCMKCHDDSVYTRQGHFVTSREALMKQVSRCAMNANTHWSGDDVNDVVDYLNATYYQFD